MESKKIKDLVGWEQNPRTISSSDQRILYKTLQKYGDLSGIVFNRRNGRLVTAHQRNSWFDSESDINISNKYDPPTRTGTVAEGFVERDGEKFSYREVDWSEETHAAAAIAANKAGGDWDWTKLKDVMTGTLASTEDWEDTGWNTVELENMFGDSWGGKTPAPAGEEVRAQNASERVDDFVSADMRQVILWFGIKEFEQFNAWSAQLISETGKETKTDALYALLEAKYGAPAQV